MLTFVRAMIAGVPRWVWIVLAGLLLLRVYGDHRARSARAELRQQHAVEIARWKAHASQMEEAARASWREAEKRQAEANRAIEELRKRNAEKVKPIVRTLREYRAPSDSVCVVPPEIDAAARELAER